MNSRRIGLVYGLLAALGCTSGGGGGVGGDADADTDSDADCLDADGDGYAASVCGGDDCDDADPAISPAIDEDAWTSVVVTSDAPLNGAHALAVDSSGDVHLLYRETTYVESDVGDAYYGRSAGGDGPFSRELVGQSALGYYSMAIDADDVVHLAWTGVFGSVGYANDARGSFVVEYPTTDQDNGLAITIGPDDLPRLAYGTGFAGPAISTKRETGWETEMMGGSLVTFIAVGLDGAGIPHSLESYEQDGFGVGRIGHRWNPTGAVDGWMFETAVDHGRKPELVVEADGRMHATYVNEDVFLAETDGSSPWSTETIFDGYFGDAALALDSDGAVHVAAWDASAVRYATNRGGSWHDEIVAEGISPAGDVTIAIDDAADPERIYVGYVDSATNEVRIARAPAANGIDDDCDGTIR